MNLAQLKKGKHPNGFTAKDGRKLCRLAGKELAIPKEEIDLYIDEAEHQDGYGYWKQFRSYNAIREDLKLFSQEINK